MKTLTVELKEKSYPIYIGAGLLNNTDLLSQHISSNQVMIVSNERVASLYLDKVKKLLTNVEVASVILPDGEVYKTLDSIDLVISALLAKRFDRHCTIVALGGGIVGDIAGFAAASYQRGVSFIQIPTSLLAQVDSSVGGKTGVNHRLGKNMIGAFYQPKCVLIDTDTLATLDPRQFSAGLAEVIKYALIMDNDFFVYLQQNIKQIINKDEPFLTAIIGRSCAYKAQIVAEDELEAGRRALLNFGHTFGHAIETVAGYGEYLHGEAVAIGLMMAAELSRDLSFLPVGDVLSIRHLLLAAKLPVSLDKVIAKKDFLNAMAIDKKARQGVIRLVLLKHIGKAYLSDDYDSKKFNATIDQFLVH